MCSNMMAFQMALNVFWCDGTLQMAPEVPAIDMGMAYTSAAEAALPHPPAYKLLPHAMESIEPT